MNRTRFPKSNDPPPIDARRTDAAESAASSSVILVGILVLAVLTACLPTTATSPDAREATSALPAESNDPAAPATSIEEMRLETDELHEYTMYMYG